MAEAAPARAGAAQGLGGAIERYFETSLYLLVVTGFITLSSTGKLDLPSLALVTAALLFRGYLLVRGRHLLIPERWTSYLAVVYAVFYLLDFFVLSGSLVSANVHLALLVMVSKLFSVQRNRDHLYLVLLSFGAVLLAAMLTVDSIFLASFCVFLLLAVSTFISMEMKRSVAAAAGQERAPQQGARRLNRALSTTAGVMMLAILAASSVLFFALPRLSAGYLRALTERNVLVSGFSDDVNLGEIGEIKQSSTVVMHIQVEGDTTGAYELKWRGLSLSSFDGQRWHNISNAPTVWNSTTGRYDLARMRLQNQRAMGDLRPEGPLRMLRYRVLMEPVGTNIFFFAPVPDTLSGKYREISMDDGGAVRNEDRRLIDIYNASSNLALPSPEALRRAAGTPPVQISNVYLQLPKLDARIPELARQITAGEPTAYDQAIAIERYLKSHYGYTLVLPSTRQKDPLAYFLFERKRGHCEYFASAMAVMLRTLGIPSRVVNGFRGGEFNDVTDSYILRGRDAHSWVEAYFPGAGWVSFDPTPPDPGYSQGRWSRMMLYMDAAGEFWREWVINYDFTHQETMAYGVLGRSRQGLDRARLWLRHKYEQWVRKADKLQEQAASQPRRWGGTAVGVVVALLLAFNGPRMWRALRRQRVARAPEKAPQKAASIWYERMTRTVGRRGFPKSPAQTPEEYVATIADPRLKEPVERFTGHYERARFGESVEDAKVLPEIYEEISSKK